MLPFILRDDMPADAASMRPWRDSHGDYFNMPRDAGEILASMRPWRDSHGDLPTVGVYFPFSSKSYVIGSTADIVSGQ